MLNSLPKTSFVRIEKLGGRAKLMAQEQGLSDGLAIMRVSINSAPEYSFEKVEGDPLSKLLEVGKKEGITQEAIDSALSKAFNLD